MYGKALLFVILVVVGAVLPYLLADEKFVGSVSGVVSGDPTISSPESVNIAPPGTVTKPTTAGKPVTISSPSAKSKYDSRYASQATRNVSQPQYAARQTAQNRSAVQPPIGNRNTVPDPALLGPPTVNAYQNPSTFGSSVVGASVIGPSLGSRPLQAETTSLVGPRGIPLEHLLSFNVTPQWVSENWSRVTTRLAEVDLQGWRVPVSLEAPFDLIGSTTYYFDRQRHLQRIILHGFTSNPQPIVEMAQSRYRMQRIPSYQTEMYVHGNARGPLGGLRIGSSSVRKARGRSEVLLELNRDGSPFGVSYEFADELRNLQQGEISREPIPEAPIFPEYERLRTTSPRTVTTPARRGFSSWFGSRPQSSTQPQLRSLQRIGE